MYCEYCGCYCIACLQFENGCSDCELKFSSDCELEDFFEV